MRLACEPPCDVPMGPELGKRRRPAAIGGLGVVGKGTGIDKVAD